MLPSTGWSALMLFVRNQIFDRCDDVTETSGENVGVTQDPRMDTSALPF